MRVNKSKRTARFDARSLHFKYFVVALWLLFTVSLCGWWFLFGIRQLDLLGSSKVESVTDVIRYQHMLFWEGGALFLSLIIGAGALAWLVYHENRQRKAVSMFLAAFTHELKTPLASLRLQAEVLEETLQGKADQTLLGRIKNDVNRLLIQLDNSLFLASMDSQGWYEERARLSELIDTMRPSWQSINFQLKRDALLVGDRRIIECMARNVIQNSYVHGKATEVVVDAQIFNSSRVKVSFCDNGRGFPGDIQDLGKPFQRMYKGSGSGFGIYLIKELAGRLGGSVELENNNPGFAVVLILKGEIL